MRSIVTTEIGLERTAAGHINDVTGLMAMPFDGLRGLLLVESTGVDAAVELSRIPEVNSAITVQAECPADLESIVRAGKDLAQREIHESSTFAVDTVKRGKHSFTSIDVNVALGSVIDRDVNLESPDFSVCVEIIRETAYLAVIAGKRARERPGGFAHRIAGKVSVVQMFYENESELTEAMGHRIGRAAQAFGVKELVLAHSIGTEAEDFARFCLGASKGRQTRLKKVRRIHGHRTRKVPIRVADIFQVARHRQGEPMVIASAFGEPVSDCCDRAAQLFSGSPTVNLFIGARKGLPKGLHRFADLIIDLTPGMTFATEHGIPAAVTGLISCVQFDSTETEAMRGGDA